MTDLHLLDANALIDGIRLLPIDRIPGFWTWLVEMDTAGTIKIPLEIYDEVAPSSGMLPEWLRQSEVRAALVLQETANMTLVRRVLEVGYAPDLDDVEIEGDLGKDPFLVAAALSAPGRFVVTREVSKRTPNPCKAEAPRRV